MAAIRGNKRPIKQAYSHRWMVDHDYDSQLSPEEQEYLRTFLNEYYYNTRDSDPAKQIHKDFVRDGKPVKAMTESGYGIYKAYNEAERDLYSKLQTASPRDFVGHLVSADAEATFKQNRDESFDPSDIYPTVSSHEDDVVTKLDMQSEAEDADLELVFEEAGTSPMVLSVEVKRPGQPSITVTGTTYLNARGIIVRDIHSTEKIWPDDREAAVKLLHSLRYKMQEKRNK